MRRVILAAAVAFAALAAPQGSGRAETLGPEDARRGVAQGRIRPLGQILTAAGVDEQHARLVDLHLAMERQRIVYSVTVLSENGRYRVVTLDARTAEILSEELK